MKSSVSRARSRASVDDRIRSAGLRRTAVRAAVVRHLEALDAPATHGEIAEVVAPLGFDRATVFRTLVSLTSAGLARRVELGDRVYRYELATRAAAPTSPTFTCDTCDESKALPFAAVELREKLLRGVSRVSRIYIRGVCSSCAAAAK